jgi:hypothetical protein
MDNNQAADPRAGQDCPRTITPNLTAGLRLDEQGYWVIPIYPPGLYLKNRKKHAEGKEPFGPEWGLERNSDQKLFDKFDAMKKMSAEQGLDAEPGIGIGLGPGRAPGGDWLIDIEGDGPEADESRRKLFDGEVPRTPGWGSTRGGHQLFTAKAERLLGILARIKGCEIKRPGQPGVYHLAELPEIELRIGGYKDKARTVVKQLQSVVPPTVGTNGQPRTWHEGTEGLDPAPLPEAAYRCLQDIAFRVELAADRAKIKAAKEARKAKAITKASKGTGNGQVRGMTFRATGSRATGYEKWFDAKKKGLAEKVANAPQGEMRTTLLHCTNALAGYIYTGYIDAAEVEAAMTTAGETCGLEPGRIAETVKAGIEFGLANPLPWPEGLDRPTDNPIDPPEASDTRADNGQATGTTTPEANGQADGPEVTTEAPVTEDENTDDDQDRPRFANYDKDTITEIRDDRPKDKVVPIAGQLPEIDANLEEISPGWPKRVGIDTNARLFLETPNHAPIYIDSADRLFAWIDARAQVDWGRGNKHITQKRYHEHLRLKAPRFDCIEALPHFPPIPGAFYMHPPIPAPTGCLETFLDFFTPDQPEDRELIKAFIITLFWGGEPGTRPAFLITGPDDDPEQGRGVGKSWVLRALGELVTRPFDATPEEDMAAIKTRLLSDDGLDARLVRLDNVKTHRFSWSDLEGLITSPVISGKALYRGEGKRPNTLVWGITLNGASLSKDLAQRVIPIRVRRPARYSKEWEESVLAFARKHRWEIMADVQALLEAPIPTLEVRSRWASWEADVLTRVSGLKTCQDSIHARQEHIDDDNAERDLIRDYFCKQLEQRKHNPLTEVVFIPSLVAADWLNEVTKKRLQTNQASSHLAGLGIPELRKSAKAGNRGWKWQGEQASNHTPATSLKEDTADLPRIGGGYERW